MWTAISIFILRNRWPILAVFMAATAFMAWQASSVKISYDFTSTVPSDNPMFKDFQEFKKTFGEDGNVMVIGVKTPSVFNLDFYKGWYDLGERIKAIEGIEGVLSVAHAYNIVKNPEKKSFEVVPLVQSLPSSQTEVDSLRKELLNLPFYQGLIHNEASGTTLMAVSFSKALLDSKERLVVVDMILDMTDHFAERYEVTLHHSGMPYIRTYTVNTIAREIKVFMSVAVAILALLLFLLFRNLYAVIFPTLVVGFSAVWSLGLLNLFGYKVTMLTGLLPTLIVVTGIPNCVYLINKYHLEFKKHSNKQKALTRTVAKTGNVLWYVNVTTAIGFGVCYFTNVQILSEFGMVSFVSSLALFFISIAIIPVGFSFLPEPKYRHTLHLDNRFFKRVLNRFEIWTSRKPWAVFAVTGVVVAISVYGITRIESKGFVLDDMPKRSKVYTDLKFFEKHFNGVLPFEVIINTGRPRGAYDLIFLSNLDEAQDSLARLGVLSKPLSVAEAVKFGMQAYRNGNPLRYRLPNSFEMASDPFLRSYISNSDLTQSLDLGFVDDSARLARISFQIEDLGSDSLPKMLARIKPMLHRIVNGEREASGKVPYDITVTGTSLLATEGFNYLVGGLVNSVLIAFVIIAVMMAFLFRTVRMLFISLIPNVVPLIVTAGIMGFFNIPLKPSTVIIFGITFGITVDSTIHFLAKYRQELYRHRWDVRTTVIESLRETGLSMIYTSLILFFGFIVFAGSRFEGTVNLGRLTSITLVVGTLCNLVLLPALLIVFGRATSRQAINLEPVMEVYLDEDEMENGDAALKHEESSQV